MLIHRLIFEDRINKMTPVKNYKSENKMTVPK